MKKPLQQAGLYTTRQPASDFLLHTENTIPAPAIQKLKMPGKQKPRRTTFPKGKRSRPPKKRDLSKAVRSRAGLRILQTPYRKIANASTISAIQPAPICHNQSCTNEQARNLRAGAQMFADALKISCNKPGRRLLAANNARPNIKAVTKAG